MHRVSVACFIVLSPPTFYSLPQVLLRFRYSILDINDKILAAFVYKSIVDSFFKLLLATVKLSSQHF